MGCLGDGGAESKEQKQKNKEIEKQIEKDKQRYKATHRLLLLGKHAKLYRRLGYLKIMCLYSVTPPA